MIALSPKTLRVLTAAISEFASASERGRWAAWQQSHGIRRRDDGQWDVARAPSALPEDIVHIARGALQCWIGRLRDIDREDLAEEAVADLDNELSHVCSVERLIES